MENLKIKFQYINAKRFYGKNYTAASLIFALIILKTNCFSQNNFKKTTLTRDFISEGVAVADLNKDGKQDIVAGYYWS